MEMASKLGIYSESSESSKTYVFHDEDHTIGNSLRYVLMRNPDVEFCGYTIPHPTEPKMHLRLQTHQGTDSFYCISQTSTNTRHRSPMFPSYPSYTMLDNSSDECLRSGLKDLHKVSAAIGDTYSKQLLAFKRKSKSSK